MARSTVAVKFTGDVKDLQKSLSDAERDLGGFGSRVRGAVVPALAGIGAAAGAALIDGLFDKMERDNVQARLVGSLGLDEAEAKQLGETAGSVYADGFGESFEQVSDAVATVMSELGDNLPADAFDPLTRKALDFAQIFQVDVNEAIGTVGFLLRNDLVADANEAFDVLTAGLQRTPKTIREEIFPTFAEYSEQFAALGIDASEAFNLILEVATESSVGIDKVGDAVKEFLIRSTDGSKSTHDAFVALQLDAEETANALLAGGDQAQEAMQTVVEALLSVEDPSERARIAVALFGTPIEDLSVDQIPELLTALANMDEGLGDVEGAANDAAAGLDNMSRDYEKAKRKFEGFQQDFVVRVVDGSELIIAAFATAGQRAGDFASDVEDAMRRAEVSVPGATNAIGGLIAALVDAAGAARTLNSIISSIPGGPRVDAGLQAGIDAEASRQDTARDAFGKKHQGGTFFAPIPGGEGLAVLRDREEIVTPEDRRSGTRGGGVTFTGDIHLSDKVDLDMLAQRLATAGAF